jgi:hypothetical protein
LLAYGRCFSPCTPASSTTNTGCHDIAEILLKVALNTINQSCKRLGKVGKLKNIFFILIVYILVIMIFSGAC